MFHDTREAPFIESRIDDRATTLRGRMCRYGYVFVRSAVPSDIVLTIRDQVLARCETAGWLQPGLPRVHARAHEPGALGSHFGL
jgi:hypothetical protein